MTLPLVLPCGGWTKKRDGMCLTETSCKLLVFLEVIAEIIIILELFQFTSKTLTTGRCIFINVQPASGQTQRISSEILVKTPELRKLPSVRVNWGEMYL